LSEVLTFVAAYIGGLTGVLTGVLPAIWLIKKKLEKSPIGAIFG